MPTSFSGFPPATFGWLEGIEANNNRDWFQANRETYDETVRGALDLMLEELADDLGGRVKLFRQNRDIRFSNDKSPYKTATYGVIQGRPDSLAALYAQLTSAGLFCGTGYYMLARDQLDRLRDGIVDDKAGPRLEKIVAGVEGAGVELFGETLKTAPRGYPRDHPRVRLLRYKSLVAGSRLTAGKKGIGRARALAHARDTWAACEPMNAWLDEHVRASELPPPVSRFRR